jgi:elongation factor G
MAIPVESIRSFAFCGHGSCGKTSLVDKLLLTTGAVSGLHNVDDGTSVADFDDEEKHHKHTIESSLCHFSAHDRHFFMLDTPGYPDFIGQTIGALHAVDTAVIVIHAHSGIGVNTRRTFQEATKLGLGKIIVLNRMDDDNIDYPGLIASIKELWGNRCVPLNVPIGSGHDFRGVASTLNPPANAAGALLNPKEISEALLESIIEVDEEVTERYFEGVLPTEAELSKLIVRAIAAGSLVPIVCTSAKTGVGLPELIETLALCCVPGALIPRTATKDGEEIQIEPTAEGPLMAQVFKTRIDPFVQKLSFVRIFSGTLKKDENVHASSARKPIKIGNLLRMQGGETSAIDSAGPGEILALAKLEDLHTGSSLGDYEFPPIEFPTPMVGLAATPKAHGDESKLSGAIHKLEEEDPTFHASRDPQTKEFVITGMSELHLSMLQERLKRRDRVEVQTHEPKIPYRETIQADAEGSYRHKKQSGGRGQFGEVHIRLYPFPQDMPVEEFCSKERFPHLREYHFDPEHNFVWVDSIVGGTIPNNFLPAVEKGFKERLDRGVVAGYQVQNVCAEVYFGKHHPVDSSEAAFKIAGSMAFRNVFQEAKPSLLEPIVKLEVTVPADHVGDINSDMSSRRGRVVGLDSAGGGLQTVEVEVPLSEVSTYARTLSSLTGGQGSYTMDFSHYEVVPGNVQKEIVEKAAMKEEEEE